MPIFDHRCPTGHAFERMGSYRRYVKCPKCGKPAKVDIVAQHRGFTKPVRAKWPLESNQMGVIPQQVAEARECAQKYGVPIAYKDSGEAIFQSEQNRRDVFKAMHGLGHPQMRDRSGYN